MGPCNRLMESNRSGTNQGTEWKESWNSNQASEATDIEPVKSMRKDDAPSQEGAWLPDKRNAATRNAGAGCRWRRWW
ncbi:hypothetical protein EUGRSUZ_D00566 [Eucalyptus grandis]|uniref:Uncharacterized protein n=2 Tax=Eucalyptus grandis TaxID=71139 RepID=A0ACC3L3S3_EUCGR|nr:hypothetical protein EUGRSUZ_D00566 [Eucalyptus grandis]